MNVVRGFERRLERILEGVAGRVFSGRLHPAEIAGRLAREADFARFDHETGPATANLYTLMVNPRDLNTDPAELAQSLTEELERHTTDQGLRLEGPCRVEIETSAEVSPGTVTCHVEVVPGPGVTWARLVATGETHDVERNRVLIGRRSGADVTLPHDDVSRSHALLWREGGRYWVRDLGSANGTTVDGTRVGDDPLEILPGSALGVAGHRYRLTET
ncbi:MAG: FHA domain-containing protein [Actinobacteria bacterium]|nr:FHA domain-containing protein [Actinomycetota bacterium]MCI0678102.1 FHA domain-containing protein [Actinomycetota bacterium]